MSGLDFPDDGRAVARVDWDHDGDLDFWVGNRSSPQVRFLRNDVRAGHHHVSLLLVGEKCNRDAVGARVELKLKGVPQLLIKTVRAGDAFLSQSSRWVHFGLGAATEIERLAVRWPGGKVAEEVAGARVDGRYRIVEGAGRVEPWTVRREPLRLEAAALPPVPATDPKRVVSPARLPVPQLAYTAWSGELTPVFGVAPKAPTLVILWASWCQPCLQELGDLALRAEDLRRRGVRVVALSVDGLDPRSKVSSEDLQSLLRRLEFPFAAGAAREETVAKLQMVHNRLFDLHRPFPVPTSFLIDGDGALAVIYRGRVPLDRLLRDVEASRSVTQKGRGRLEALPFAGRWIRAPGRISPFALAWELLEGGFAVGGLDYIEAHRQLLQSHIGYPRLAVLAGNAHLGRGAAAKAVALYREALALDADYADAQNNLAWLLATHRDEQLRNGEEAVRLAEAAVRQTRGGNPSFLNTLAAAYAEAGEYEKAVQVATQAMERARQLGQEELAARIARRLELFRSRRPYRDG